MLFNLLQNFIGEISQEVLILTEIGILIIIATVLAFLARIIKQPLIPAYILAGILIGPLVLGLVKDPGLISALSQIGVAFLIFAAGLEIKLTKLKEVGKVSSVGGVLQIALLFLIAFFITTWMGFAGYAPVYIGLVVAFSSTMIVVALLAQKKTTNSLQGRIIIGILLVQDIAAIIALAILSSDLSLNSVLIVLGKASVFAIVALILSKVASPVFRKAADNHELLLLVSISFLFLFVIGSFFAGLSLIIGAFFAGVALANSDYKTEIQGKITPLREFFAVLFFVALGMQLKMISGNFAFLLLVLLILVVIAKPFVIMFLVRLFGYKKRTAFFTGNSLAQTSEFSLIIATLGLSLGHISQDLFSTLVLLTIVTMALTTYLIVYEKRLIGWFGWLLNFLERVKSRREELEFSDKKINKIILFGCHRMGSLILKEFEKHKEDIFVVDYNPEIIKSLMDKKIPCVYGDFMNDEVLEKANIRSAEIVISTIPDFEDNLYLVRKVKKINPKADVIIVASRISEALDLYKGGADYVILPKVVGGEKSVDLARKIRRGKRGLKELKKEHVRYLNNLHHLLY